MSEVKKYTTKKITDYSEEDQKRWASCTGDKEKKRPMETTTTAPQRLANKKYIRTGGETR